MRKWERHKNRAALNHARQMSAWRTRTPLCQTMIQRKNIIHLPEAFSIQLYLNSVRYSWWDFREADSRKAGAGPGWLGGPSSWWLPPWRSRRRRRRGAGRAQTGQEELKLGLSSEATMATQTMDQPDSQVTFKRTLTALKAQLNMMSKRQNVHAIRSEDNGCPGY